MKKILVIAAMIGAVCMLSGCIDIKTDVEIDSDGAGTATLTYTVSRLIESMVQTGDGSGVLPLPINENELQLRADEAEGVSLESYQRSDDDEFYRVEAVFSFDNVEVFLTRYLDLGWEQESEGGNNRLTLTVYEGTRSQIDEVSRGFLENLFSENKIALNYTLPSPALSAEGGTIEDNGKTVAFSIPLLDLLDSYTPVRWSVLW